MPREIGLALSLDEPRIDRRHVVLPGDGKNRVEGAADRARHVLGTDQGTVVGFEPLDALLKVLWPAVVVKRDHIRLFYLDPGNWTQLFQRRPVAIPNAAGEGLDGFRRTRPGKDLRQQSQHESAF